MPLTKTEIHTDLAIRNILIDLKLRLEKKKIINFLNIIKMNIVLHQPYEDENFNKKTANLISKKVFEELQKRNDISNLKKIKNEISYEYKKSIIKINITNTRKGIIDVYYTRN
jgi:hypothetical protein